MTPARCHIRQLCVPRGLEPFGPWPAACVAALGDLGLTETEIARYFRVTPQAVRLARCCPEQWTLAHDAATSARGATKAAP